MISPLGAGVSGIETDSVSPARDRFDGALHFGAAGNVTVTPIPFSVDSPWFWTVDFDFGGFFGRDPDRFFAQFGAVDADAGQFEAVHARGFARRWSR